MGLTNQRLLEMFVNNEDVQIDVCNYEITKFQAFSSKSYEQLEIIADVLVKIKLIDNREFDLLIRKTFLCVEATKDFLYKIGDLTNVERSKMILRKYRNEIYQDFKNRMLHSDKLVTTS